MKSEITPLSKIEAQKPKHFMQAKLKACHVIFHNYKLRFGVYYIGPNYNVGHQ